LHFVAQFPLKPFVAAASRANSACSWGSLLLRERADMSKVNSKTTLASASPNKDQRKKSDIKFMGVKTGPARRGSTA
jgi:hypothetical protein